MKTKSMVKELAVLSEVAGNLRRQTEGDTDSVQDDFDYAHILLDDSPKPKVIQPIIWGVETAKIVANNID